MDSNQATPRLLALHRNGARRPKERRCNRWSIPMVVLVLLGPAHGAFKSPGNILGSAIRPATLLLDWYPNSDHGGIFAGLRQGSYRRRGIALTVQVPSDTSAQLKLVAAGRADFGISYETDLLAARAQHIPVQSVMCLIDHPLNSIMSLGGSHIRRPRDLVGKTVGIAGTPSDRPILGAMLKRDGVTIQRVRVVNVGYNLLPILLAHRVDAVIGVYWSWEALQARARGAAVNILRVEQWGVPDYCELVVVSAETTVARRPQFVRDFVQATKAGYTYADTHPDAAYNALKERDRTLQRALVLQSLHLLQRVVPIGPAGGKQELHLWRAYAGWLARNHLIARPVDAAAAFTNRFI